VGPYLAGTTYVVVYLDPTLPTIKNVNKQKIKICLRFGYLGRYKSAATMAFLRRLLSHRLSRRLL
jgi:hypothetical protein